MSKSNGFLQRRRGLGEHIENGTRGAGIGMKRAIELGPIELVALLAWELNRRPRALRNVRTKYKQFCVELFQRLEKARSGR